MNKKYLMIALGIIILSLSSEVIYLFTKNRELNNLYSVVDKELETYKNKEGEYIAKIESYETSSTKTFLELQTKDSLTVRLQKEVKRMKKQLKNQGSITTIVTETKVDTVFNTVVIPSENKEYPNYKADFNLGGWVYGSTLASKDSTSLFLRVKNDYTVVVGTEPKGFMGMGKAVPFAEVTNKNPYTETTSMKSYQITLPKEKRFSVGPAIGFGFNGEFVGISVQYSLIRF